MLWAQEEIPLVAALFHALGFSGFLSHYSGHAYLLSLCLYLSSFHFAPISLLLYFCRSVCFSGFSPVYVYMFVCVCGILCAFYIVCICAVHVWWMCCVCIIFVCECVFVCVQYGCGGCMVFVFCVCCLCVFVLSVGCLYM